jgi:hypothetical protein
VFLVAEARGASILIIILEEIGDGQRFPVSLT